MNYYLRNILPEKDVIFVFGSNPEGRHGAGSARVAVKNFGAIYGQGEGLQGNSYAIPTVDLRIAGRPNISLDNIRKSIAKLYIVAEAMPEKKFKVAYRNTANERTLCGYTGKQLCDCFLSAGVVPNNVYFSKEWYDIISN